MKTIYALLSDNYRQNIDVDVSIAVSKLVSSRIYEGFLTRRRDLSIIADVGCPTSQRAKDYE